MPLPLVAILGRPNVGKSTLFNALLGERVAITDPTAGTTRDRIAAILKHEGRAVELVDTGGLGLVDESRLEDHINAQVDLAMTEAEVVVFVVDVRDGITGLDRDVARRLRKLDKRIILAVNKADARHLEQDAAEFHALGLGEPIPVSAQNMVNTTEVRDRVFAALPEAPQVAADPAPRIAIVGRRNAGKSTFLNALAGSARVIASAIPGTTRDAVDVRLEHKGRPYVFIDTAGVVKKTKVDQSIEFYAQVRTIEAIARCDVALLLLDISEKVEQADKKTAAMIVDSHKPAVVVGNKWDLTRASAEEFGEYYRKALPAMAFAPVSFTSAKDGVNLWETVRVAEDLLAQSRLRMETAAVNKVFQRALEERSPKVIRSKVPKIYYATQVGTSPPSFVAFVNDPELFPANYRRFLENRIRDSFPFSEVPIRLTFRARTRSADGRGRREVSR
jgi:GTP-binding protein